MESQGGLNCLLLRGHGHLGLRAVICGRLLFSRRYVHSPFVVGKFVVQGIKTTFTINIKRLARFMTSLCLGLPAAPSGLPLLIAHLCKCQK